jgi:uncharacterized MAPEG superfamily protein
MTGIAALLLFAAWTLVLMLTYVFYRTGLVLAGRKRADSWTRGRPSEDPGFIVRAQNAHMNCVENLPVFAAIVLSAYALGRAPVADHVASYVLGARLAQSTVHLIGVNHWLVFVRGSFFTIQVALFLYMIGELVA